MATNFHDIRFPTAISFGASGGPERRTEIVALANGHEERNAPWAHSRRRYDAGMGMRSLDDLEDVVAFFEARMGQLYGFRWKDWSDYKSCAASADPAATDQAVATGDGTTTSFPLVKTYASGEGSYARPISKPVAQTVKVALDGAETTDFDVDVESGALIFSSAPDAGVTITAGFEFDVPVRFDTDRIETSIASFSVGEIPDIPVIEVRI